MTHLKKETIIQYFFFTLFAGIIIYIFLSHIFLHTKNTIDKKYLAACREVLGEKIVTIQNDTFSPRVVSARQCEKLTFVNKDLRYHDIALGEHSNHLLYPNFKETILVPGQNYSFLLSAYGTYSFHDHFKESIQGILVIKQ